MCPSTGPALPGQRHARFDRLVILIQPGGKASHGVDSTRSGALPAGSSLARLPLAHQGRHILREVDRLGHLGRLRVELRELLGLGWCALRLAPQH